MYRQERSKPNGTTKEGNEVQGKMRKGSTECKSQCPEQLKQKPECNRINITLRPPRTPDDPILNDKREVSSTREHAHAQGFSLLKAFFFLATAAC